MGISSHPAEEPPARPREGAFETHRPVGADLYVELPMSAEAPQIARSSVTAWAEGAPVPGHRIDRLRLIVSEVVTNAVRHSGAAPDSPVRLAASRVGRDVLVTVTDAGEGALPRMREPDPLAGGYGLHVVEVEARHWGVERADGTRVWFTV